MRSKEQGVPAAVAAALLGAGPAGGQEADKSGYTLLDPTPREQWRELSPDRPDATESPRTVDAGAVQLELSFADYAKNGGSHTWTAAPLNLKLGLLNNVDIQWVLDPYVREDRHRGGTERGFGDMQIRLKVNLWGNDPGPNDVTAFAVMPYIKIPTASDGLGNDEVEGGFILPLSIDLSETLGLGLMGEVDFVYDEVEDDHDVEFLHTAVLGIDLTESLGFYVEGIGVASSDGTTDYRALLGTGVTYAVSNDVVLDFGVNIGLTGDADDVNVFSGITVRF